MSKLLVHGWFDVNQFYPKGSSDADTIRVKVATIHFQSNGKTRDIYGALSEACSHDAKTDKHERVMAAGALRVRLEGIDAYELHCGSATQQGVSYRQVMGATTAQELGTRLSPLAVDGWVPCEVVTNVDAAEDAFDVYGRLIGNVLVGTQRLNINRMLLVEGLALPSFYESAAPAEIQDMLAAAAQARFQNKLVWSCYSSILSFDPTLTQVASVNPIPEVGRSVLPKIFRRLAEYHDSGASGTFREFLGSKGEQVMLTEDFLSQGRAARKFPLAECVAQSGTDTCFLPGPEQLVFLEARSALFQYNKATQQYEPWTLK
jgi:endonuclease YncB( thermonuclease family)